MSEIHWARADGKHFLVHGDEEMADGNTPNENGRTDYIGIGWDGIILYGTPMQVLKALADAALTAAQHMDEKE
jgi:hypothetical protein